VTLDPEEQLLWALLHRFETDTLQRYHAHVPALVTPAKEDLLAQLLPRAASDQALEASPLATSTRAVLKNASSGDHDSTVFVQGLVLELLGRTIYAATAEVSRLSLESRSLAERGRDACAAVSEAAVRRCREHIGTGENAFIAFAGKTHEVVGALDALGEPVELTFGERYGIRFAELMGDFTADLVASCLALEMPRRKVIGHLAGASMGL
jgi:hypothetical protein